VFINRHTRPPSGYSDFAWGDVTFHVAGGANSFGFSLQGMEMTTELFVNGVSRGSINGLLPTGAGRNGHLRIDAAPGETI